MHTHSEAVEQAVLRQLSYVYETQCVHVSISIPSAAHTTIHIPLHVTSIRYLSHTVRPSSHTSTRVCDSGTTAVPALSLMSMLDVLFPSTGDTGVGIRPMATDGSVLMLGKLTAEDTLFLIAPPKAETKNCNSDNCDNSASSCMEDLKAEGGDDGDDTNQWRREAVKLTSKSIYTSTLDDDICELWDAFELRVCPDMALNYPALWCVVHESYHTRLQGCQEGVQKKPSNVPHSSPSMFLAHLRRSPKHGDDSSHTSSSLTGAHGWRVVTVLTSDTVAPFHIHLPVEMKKALCIGTADLVNLVPVQPEGRCGTSSTTTGNVDVKALCTSHGKESSLPKVMWCNAVGPVPLSAISSAVVYKSLRDVSVTFEPVVSWSPEWMVESDALGSDNDEGNEGHSSADLSDAALLRTYITTALQQYRQTHQSAAMDHGSDSSTRRFDAHEHAMVLSNHSIVTLVLPMWFTRVPTNTGRLQQDGATGIAWRCHVYRPAAGTSAAPTVPPFIPTSAYHKIDFIITIHNRTPVGEPVQNRDDGELKHSMCVDLQDEESFQLFTQMFNVSENVYIGKMANNALYQSVFSGDGGAVGGPVASSKGRYSNRHVPGGYTSMGGRTEMDIHQWATPYGVVSEVLRNVEIDCLQHISHACCHMSSLSLPGDGLLVAGPIGMGKTIMLQRLARHMNKNESIGDGWSYDSTQCTVPDEVRAPVRVPVYAQIISCKALVRGGEYDITHTRTADTTTSTSTVTLERSTDELLEHLTLIFARAHLHAPAVLMFDDLDVLCPSHYEPITNESAADNGDSGDTVTSDANTLFTPKSSPDDRLSSSIIALHWTRLVEKWCVRPQRISHSARQAFLQQVGASTNSTVPLDPFVQQCLTSAASNCSVTIVGSITPRLSSSGSDGSADLPSALTSLHPSLCSFGVGSDGLHPLPHTLAREQPSGEPSSEPRALVTALEMASDVGVFLCGGFSNYVPLPRCLSLDNVAQLLVHQWGEVGAVLKLDGTSSQPRTSTTALLCTLLLNLHIARKLNTFVEVRTFATRCVYEACQSDIVLAVPKAASSITQVSDIFYP